MTELTILVLCVLAVAYLMLVLLAFASIDKQRQEAEDALRWALRRDR